MTNDNDCFCEALFGFKRAREEAMVRDFYGPSVYEALKKWEAEQRERRIRMAREAIGFDDVGSQVLWK